MRIGIDNSSTTISGDRIKSGVVSFKTYLKTTDRGPDLLDVLEGSH